MNARRFSAKYVEIVADVLDLRGSRSVPADPEARVEELRERLENHFSIWHRGALESIRRRNASTAFHFGNSDRLSRTLEYAPVYVDHVVLQDLLYRQLQSRAAPEIQLRRILPVAREVCNWKSLIEDGRISIVPAPTYWDRRIREHHSRLPAEHRLFAAPLYASLLLDCSPMTDVPYLERKLPRIARGTIGKGIASSSARQTSVVPDDPLTHDEEFYRNELAALQHEDVFDLLPNLLGVAGTDDDPELWCLKDPDPDDVRRLADDVGAFRSRVHEVIREIEGIDDAAEIRAAVDVASEHVREEYESIQQRRSDYRRELGTDSLRVVLQSIPVLVGATHQDLLVALLSAGAGVGGAGLEVRRILERWRDGSPATDSSVFRVFEYFRTH